jgi:hypothetical protein
MVMAKAPWSRGSTAATAAAGSAFALLELVVDQVGDDLAVGLRLEGAALGLHLLAQGPEILDDAVVDERDAADDVRVGVADGRRAVGRPARMGDPDRPGERIGGELAARLSSLPSARRRSSRRRGWCRCRPSHSRDIRAASAPA